MATLGHNVITEHRRCPEPGSEWPDSFPLAAALFLGQRLSAVRQARLMDRARSLALASLTESVQEAVRDRLGASC